MLTLSFSPSTIVRKNASTKLCASVASKSPARIAESVPGRRAADLLDVKAESLKDFGTHLRNRSPNLSGFALACLQDFFGEKVRVDDAHHAALLVHDGKRQKFVEHKKFARFEHRCGRGFRSNGRHDVLEQWSFPRC